MKYAGLYVSGHILMTQCLIFPSIWNIPSVCILYIDSVHIHLHRRACQACMCIFSSDQVAFSLCVFVSNFLLTNRRVTQERHSATLSTALLFYTSLPTSVSPHKGLLSSISDGNGSILRRPHSASLFWSNHKIPPKPNNRKQWGTC